MTAMSSQRTREVCVRFGNENRPRDARSPRAAGARVGRVCFLGEENQERVSSLARARDGRRRKPRRLGKRAPSRVRELFANTMRRHRPQRHPRARAIPSPSPRGPRLRERLALLGSDDASYRRTRRRRFRLAFARDVARRATRSRNVCASREDRSSLSSRARPAPARARRARARAGTAAPLAPPRTSSRRLRCRRPDGRRSTQHANRLPVAPSPVARVRPPTGCARALAAQRKERGFERRPCSSLSSVTRRSNSISATRARAFHLLDGPLTFPSCIRRGAAER